MIVTQAIAPNTMIATYGVRYFGWSWRTASGSCRCWPIEYVSRETPISPAFVAMKRIVAASIPTYISAAPWSAPRSMFCTTPSTGSPANSVASTVSPFTTGIADSATAGRNA